MDIVEFLEARIDEEEAELHHADADDSLPRASLASRMRAECAQKRVILEGWKRAAAVDGIGVAAEAQGDMALARRSMLNILAACYTSHPGFNPEWAALPTEWRQYGQRGAGRSEGLGPARALERPNSGIRTAGAQSALNIAPLLS